MRHRRQSTTEIYVEGTIPLKGCLALLRMARECKDEIELSIKGNNLCASKDNEKITIRLIGEDFP